MSIYFFDGSELNPASMSLRAAIDAARAHRGRDPMSGGTRKESCDRTGHDFRYSPTSGGYICDRCELEARPDAPEQAGGPGETVSDETGVERRIAELDDMLAPHTKWGGCPMTGREDCCDTLVIERRLLREISRVTADARALREAARALDRAAENLLLAFHDWPIYDSATANDERATAIGALADATVALRAALHPSTPTTPRTP